MTADEYKAMHDKTKLYEYLKSCLRGGHPAGQISETFGIVEYEDGTIR